MFWEYAPTGFQARLKLCFFKRRFTLMYDRESTYPSFTLLADSRRRVHLA